MPQQCELTMDRDIMSKITQLGTALLRLHSGTRVDSHITLRPNRVEHLVLRRLLVLRRPLVLRRLVLRRLVLQKGAGRSARFDSQAALRQQTAHTPGDVFPPLVKQLRTFRRAPLGDRSAQQRSVRSRSLPRGKRALVRYSVPWRHSSGAEHTSHIIATWAAPHAGCEPWGLACGSAVSTTDVVSRAVIVIVAASSSWKHPGGMSWHVAWRGGHVCACARACAA